ncbi:MAG TPA: hypothetical protein VJZ77_13160 [Blastocatellia bacterium]|nr:hypothetical protein [Blastocatellia bacterium]
MDSALPYFIGIVVLVFVFLQGAVFVGLYFLFKRVVAVIERTNELQTHAKYLLENTEPVLKMAHGVMAELKEAGGYFSQGAQHFSAIAEMAKDEVAEVKDLLGDTTSIARREVERAREKMDKVQDTLGAATDQFARATAMVQHSVLEPAREFSYAMFGLRRAIEVLFSGSRLPVNRAYQDEELFI